MLPVHEADLQETEQPHDALQLMLPVQDLLVQLTVHMPLPQVMSLLQELLPQSMSHLPAPQVILPVQELLGQVTVQSLAWEQSMSPWQPLVPQGTWQL